MDQHKSQSRAGGLLFIALVLVTACADPHSDSDSQATADSEGESSTTRDPSSSSATATSSDGTSDASGSETGEESSTTADECPEGQIGVEREFLTTPGESGLAQLDSCELWHRWYFAAPEGSVVEFALIGHDPVEAVVGYPDVAQLAPAIDGNTLIEPFTSTGGTPMTQTFTAPRSGEFAIQIRAQDTPADAEYELAITCVEGCSRETTRFPIVLVHGWTGFQNIGPLDYFYNVPGHLTDLGYPVAVTETDKYNTSLVRGEQLAEQVDGLLTQWRARKVNLIGHSQGGIDSRAMISTHGYGDRVSALITVGSPHQGALACDVALGYVPGPAQEVLFLLFDFLGAVTADEQADVEASLHSLTEVHMQGEFNPQNLDDPRVEYISYTGYSCAADEFLDPSNDCVDLVDPIWTLTHSINRADGSKGDGLVTIESAKWGDFRGIVPADHLDEVGQLLGATDPAFDHLQFFEDRASELAEGAH